jgi:DNA-binding NarL/FixJ family response regulator/signal transduction histidine kinase
MKPTRTLLWAKGIAAAAVGAALVPLVASADFAEDRELWIVLTLVIGYGFAGVGLFAWYRRPDNPVGGLMVLTAFAWYFAILERTDVPLLFSIGLLLANLFVVTAVHLVLAFPTGRLETTFDRRLVGFGYAVVTIGFVPFVLTTGSNPYGCTSCPENVFAVTSQPDFAMDWARGLGWVGVAFSVVVISRLVHRWRHASPPLRRTIGPVLLAGGALELILGVVLFLSATGIASHSVHKALFYSALMPFGLVPFLFLLGLLKGQVLRGSGLGSLVHRLGPGAGRGELRAALAEALGDPSVELAYWLPESRQYVDADGRPVAPPVGSVRGVTEVTREGRRIAAIVHDPTLLDDPELVHAAGAAAALALENERLEAELRAKVEELRTSRKRLVDVGLQQRRRLERDLHDGAQQRLVSLALSLRLVRETLRRDSDEAEQMLAQSSAELEEALKELRELARGIHPAVLSDRGLGAAVEALAHRAPLPVEIGELPAERYPEHVELAAYFVVSEALTNVAKYAAASRASVAVIQDNGHLKVEVSDDGVGGAEIERGSGLRGLDDPMRVVVAEDSVLLREGIVRVLEDAGFDVVGQAGDAEDLVRMVHTHKPHVAVVDIRMPPTNTDDGLRAAREIRRELPAIGVLVLSQYAEEGYAMELVADSPEGVGYLLKDRIAETEGFTDSVRRVGEGGSALDPEVVSLLMGRTRSDDPMDKLSGREREVMELMAEGRSNHSLSERLAITERAVEKHITSIFTKLDLPATADDHRRVLAVLKFLRA